MDKKKFSYILLICLLTSLSLSFVYIPSASASPTITITKVGSNYVASGGYVATNADFKDVFAGAVAVLHGVGGSIYLPSVLYDVNITDVEQTVETSYGQAMYVEPGIEVYGAGSSSTTLKAIGTLNYTFGCMILMAANTQLHDLTVDMNGAGISYVTYSPNAWYSGVLVGISNEWLDVDIPANNAELYNVCFKNSINMAIPNLLGIGCNLMYGYDVSLHDCSFENNYAGLFVTYQPTIADPNTYSNMMYDVDSIYTTGNKRAIYWEIGSADINLWQSVNDYVGLTMVSPVGAVSYGYVTNSYVQNASCGVNEMGAPKWMIYDNVTLSCWQNSDAYYAMSIFPYLTNTHTLTDVSLIGGWGFNAYSGSGTVTWDGGGVTQSYKNGIYAWCNLDINDIDVTYNGLEHSTNAYTDNGIALLDDATQLCRYRVTNTLSSYNWNNGIVLDHVKGSSILNNQFVNNSARGLYADYSDYNTIIGNDWSGNSGVEDAAISGEHNEISSNTGRTYRQIFDPAPAPTPTPEPDTSVNSILGQIFPIITPIAVILVAAFLGFKFAGTWGFFAGFNAGAIVLYVVAPALMPLWGIVMVILVDTLLFFGKIRG